MNKNRTARRLEDQFERLASFLYHHPFWSIWFSIVVTIVLTGVGLRSPKWIDGADRLYALQRSLARTHGALHNLLFEETRLRNSYILITRPGVAVPGGTFAAGQNESAGVTVPSVGVLDKNGESLRYVQVLFASIGTFGSSGGGERRPQLDSSKNILNRGVLQVILLLDEIVRGYRTDPLQGLQLAVAVTEEISSNNHGSDSRKDGPSPKTQVLHYDRLCRQDGRGFCENSININLLRNAYRTSHGKTEIVDDETNDVQNDTGVVLDITVEKVNLNRKVMPETIVDANAEEYYGQSGVELLVVDDYLVDLQNFRFVPLNAVLSNASGEACWRPVPPTFLLELSRREFPPTMLNASKLVVDKETNRMQFKCVTYAEAILLTYSLKDDRAWNEVNAVWEGIFLEILRPLKNAWPYIVIDVAAFRSRDDELRASTFESGDVSFIVLTILALITYTTISNFSCNLYSSRSYSGLGGALAALMGLLAGMGLCCLCGLALVPTAFVCPFLVLGIGVDDMFVILNNYALAYRLTGEQRCRAALKSSGPAISLTTLTSLTSFFVGTWNPYLAVRNFCVFCASEYSLLPGLFFGYVFVLTVFFPILCLDNQREIERTVCCLYTRPPPSRSSLPNSDIDDTDVNSDIGGAVISSQNTTQINGSPRSEDRIRRRTPLSSPARKPPKTACIPSNKHESFVFTCIAARVAQYMPHATSRSEKGNSAKREAAVWDEPEGNVGRFTRNFTLKYYGPFLMKPAAKILVLGVFGAILCIACIGFTKLERGLDLPELAPKSSYLREFDQKISTHFDTYDFVTDIFYSSGETPWWNKAFLREVEKLEADLVAEKVALRVINPLRLMLGDPSLDFGSGTNQDRGVFERTISRAVTRTGSPYGTYSKSFVFQGQHLRAWKITILPPFMKSSQERALWMLRLRRICMRHSSFIQDGCLDRQHLDFNSDGTKLSQIRSTLSSVDIAAENHQQDLSDSGDLLRGGESRDDQVEYNCTIFSPPIPYNYLMTYHESDLRMTFFVASEMATAGGTLALVAFTCLPDRRSGFIVTAIMAAIDVSVVGFMHFVGVKLNMISMVNLLISIGFAVDYSTHVAHTFLECRGPTRDHRAVEALVLMGTPVLHGAIASVLGILMLGFSQSHIFVIFFRMMSLIVLFGVAYGVVLMPVVLSFVGTFVHHEEKFTEQKLPTT